MAEIKGAVYINRDLYKYYNPPPGMSKRDVLILDIKLNYRDRIIKQLKKFIEQQVKWQQKKDTTDLRELVMSLEYHFQQRTLKMNSFMWLLYTLKADILNAGLNGDNRVMVTADELYENDLQDHAEKAIATVPEWMIPELSKQYKVYILDRLPEGEAKISCTKSTSFMNTKEHAEWIDRILIEISLLGVPTDKQADLSHEFTKWKQHLNDEKIILNDKLLTVEDYIRVQPICEVTGDPVPDNLSPHHIKTRGAGGIDYSSNLLRLNLKLHKEFHDIGAGTFATKHSEVAYKIMTALNREYPEKVGGMVDADTLLSGTLERKSEADIGQSTNVTEEADIERPDGEKKSHDEDFELSPMPAEENQKMYLLYDEDNRNCLIGCAAFGEAEESIIRQLAEANNEQGMTLELKTLVDAKKISEDHADEMMVTAGHEPIYGIGIF